MRRFDEIRRRLSEGWGLREIARAFGCSRDTVREVRDGLGVSPDAPKTLPDPLWMQQVDWPPLIHDLGLGHPLKFLWEKRTQHLTTYKVKSTTAVRSAIRIILCVMSIPARVHFCWIGPQLSWAYAFALLSAAAQAGMDEVVLHHTDELEEGAVLTALRNTAGLRLERIDARDLLAEAGARLGLSGVLADIYANLASPSQRSDVLRAAILYLQGGIYLDLDTITVASLRPLLNAPQFIGTEYIVWPHWVRSSRSWKVLAKHLALDVLRSSLRVCPGGWRGFRHVEHWYFKGINGAVMGGPAGAPLFAADLIAMAALPPARRSQPYALGPDLLQSLVGQFSGVELVIHEPGVFYPLAPEISTHWFRSGLTNLDLALRPQTLVVHWYASVRSKPYVALIDPNYVRAHRHTQLYSALVSRVLPQIAMEPAHISRTTVISDQRF